MRESAGRVSRQCLNVGSSESGLDIPSGPGRTSSPGIARCSLTQAPRSISLHRSLQNGRQLAASVHSTGAAQVGQETVFLATVSGAGRERKRHVFGALYGMGVGVLPVEEPHAATVVAAADLRVT